MLIGDASVLAIESEITHAYEAEASWPFSSPIHVRRSYVRQFVCADSMLACSHDEVEKRIAARGAHTVAFRLSQTREDR